MKQFLLLVSCLFLSMNICYAETPAPPVNSGGASVADTTAVSDLFGDTEGAGADDISGLSLTDVTGDLSEKSDGDIENPFSETIIKYGSFALLILIFIFQILLINKLNKMGQFNSQRHNKLIRQLDYLIDVLDKLPYKNDESVRIICYQIDKLKEMFNNFTFAQQQDKGNQPQQYTPPNVTYIEPAVEKTPEELFLKYKNNPDKMKEYFSTVFIRQSGDLYTIERSGAIERHGFFLQPTQVSGTEIPVFPDIINCRVEDGCIQWASYFELNGNAKNIADCRPAIFMREGKGFRLVERGHILLSKS